MMNANFLIMSGSGLYVWLSFGIVIIACSVFYYKTRKSLKKYEKEFLVELRKLSEEDRKAVLEKSKIATQVLNSQKKMV